MKKKKPEAVGFLTHHPEEGCHGLPAPVLVQGEGEVRVLEEKRPNKEVFVSVIPTCPWTAC